MRSGTSGKATVDVSIIAMKREAQEQAKRVYAQTCIERAIMKVRELRLAGMVNKAGADDIQHHLILALSVFETDAENEIAVAVG